MVQYAAMRNNGKETAVDDTTEVYAKLVVESTLLPTAELVSAFKVRPCRQWSIGDEEVRPRARKTSYKKANGFSLCSGLPKNARTEDHIADLCRQLKDVDRCLVRQIQGKYDADFRIGIDKEFDRPSLMAFGRDFLEISAAIGASIDIDVLYLADESLEYDPSLYEATVGVYAVSSEHCLFRTHGIGAFEDAVSHLAKDIEAYEQKEIAFHIVGKSPIVFLPADFIALAVGHGLIGLTVRIGA